MLENSIITDFTFFNEIKAELGITWDDDDTDNIVRKYIRQGVGVLQDDVESQIDFNEDMLARQLLTTYCRYARNKSEEFFIETNLTNIVKLEVKYGKK